MNTTRVINATTRVNSTTFESKEPKDILPIVKKKLFKKLYRDLEDANVIDIISAPTKTGGVVFTATLRVLPREEA
jgi:hypothetical protein